MHKTTRFWTILLLVTILQSLVIPVSSVRAQTPDTETPTLTPSETPTSLPTETPTETPSETPTLTPPPPTGTATLVPLLPDLYDDNYPYFRYNGWYPHTLNGLHFDSEHYSDQAGNTASFRFKGTGFNLFYRSFNTFGEVSITVDGNQVATVSLYSEYEERGKSYTSPVFSDGVHEVVITHLNGLYAAFDAIEVTGIPTATPLPSNTPTITLTPTITNTFPPTRTNTPSQTPTVTNTPGAVAYGLYDDTDNHFGYIGWQYRKAPGQILDSEHYSSVTGSTANLRFVGVGATIHFRSFTTFGVMQVYIDGVFQGAINQNDTAEVLGQTWTSPLVADGLHTLSIVHLSGTYAAFDAVTIISGGSPTPTLTASNTKTSTSTRTLPATQTPTKTATNTPLLSNTPTATRTPIPSNTPTATATLTTLQAAKYDDSDIRLRYTGWQGRTVSGLYNNSEHFSAFVGDKVEIAFNGNGISVFYRNYSSFGVMDIAIDGVSVGQINQFYATELRGLVWTSPALAFGYHTLTLTHLSGQYTVLDAIQVLGPSTSTPTQTSSYTASPTRTATFTRTASNTFTATNTFTPSRTPTISNTPTNTSTPGLIGIGTTDDTDIRIQYTGWTYRSQTGAYNNTEHVSGKLGNKVVIRFTGESLAIKYRKAANFGTIEVNIDGASYTINEYNPTTLSNQTWTSPALPDVIHTLTITHMTGLYNVLDAFVITGTPTATPTRTPSKTMTPTNTYTPSRTPSMTFTASITPTASNTPLPVGVGKYDDNDYRIGYTNWKYHIVTGLFNNTEHYSQTLNSSAGFTFTGSGFSLLHRKNKTFGTIKVYVDGALVGTLNEYAASELRNQSWISPSLTSGVHTLTLVHATGSSVVLDAITVR